MKDDNLTTDNDLLNQRQCAELLGISVQAFQRWGLDPVREEGREKFYSWADCVRHASYKQRRRTNRQIDDMPEILVPHGGNILRLLLWEQSLALTWCLQRCIRISASDLQKQLKVPKDDATRIADSVANLIPGIVDVFMTRNRDKWFQDNFDMDVDDVARRLFRLKQRQPDAPERRLGEFFRDFERFAAGDSARDLE